jgi:hypothetical protein
MAQGHTEGQGGTGRERQKQCKMMGGMEEGCQLGRERKRNSVGKKERNGGRMSVRKGEKKKQCRQEGAEERERERERFIFLVMKPIQYNVLTRVHWYKLANISRKGTK